MAPTPTHVRPEPDDPAGGPGSAEGLRAGREVGVLKQQAPLPTRAADVLVGTAFASGSLLTDSVVYGPVT